MALAALADVVLWLSELAMHFEISTFEATVDVLVAQQVYYEHFLILHLLWVVPDRRSKMDSHPVQVQLANKMDLNLHGRRQYTHSKKYFDTLENEFDF